MKFEAAPGKRIAVWVLASLGMHLMLFGALRPASRPIRIEHPGTELRWVELAPRRVVNERNPSPVRQPTGGREAVLSAPAPVQVESPPAASSVSPPESIPLPRLDHASLLASARAIAREALPQGMVSKEAASPPEDRPILPQLDHALRRETPGERRLANGLIRVVSADGRVYCLQPTPDFARGGPVEMLSPPTNCP